MRAYFFSVIFTQLFGSSNYHSYFCVKITHKMKDLKYYKPQIRNYAPNMIQKRKESVSLVKRGHRASNVTIKTYKCSLPHHAT